MSMEQDKLRVKIVSSLVLYRLQLLQGAVFVVTEFLIPSFVRVSMHGFVQIKDWKTYKVGSFLPIDKLGLLLRVWPSFLISLPL